jgi:hypothetical protein
MRARGVLLLVGGTLLTACGFPDVTYRAGSDETGADAGADGIASADATVEATGDAARDATAGDGSTADQDSQVGYDGPNGADVADSSDGPAGDGGGEPEAASEAGGDTGSQSDAHGSADGAVEGGVDAGTDASDAGPDAPLLCDQDQDTYKADGSACGGNDCCDIDKLVHPGQTGWFQHPNACGNYDYDCSGKEEGEYPSNINCAGLLGCPPNSGYLTDPGCGNSGPLYTCVLAGISCTLGTPIAQVQACH